MSDRFIFKQGIGNAGNSSHWKACFDMQEGRYTAEIRFGGAGGASYKLYEINKEIFEQIGAFEEDDYKSERLIREGGRKLYASMFDRNMPGLDEVIDRNYRKLCPWAEIVSFDGR
ncbi:MAG: hypothetical protein IJM83_10600 [Firmicutes bacterium]|nr:hypothetical protein [Bacillota bacterium]